MDKCTNVFRFAVCIFVIHAEQIKKAIDFMRKIWYNKTLHFMGKELPYGR